MFVSTWFKPDRRHHTVVICCTTLKKTRGEKTRIVIQTTVFWRLNFEPTIVCTFYVAILLVSFPVFVFVEIAPLLSSSFSISIPVRNVSRSYYWDITITKKLYRASFCKGDLFCNLVGQNWMRFLLEIRSNIHLSCHKTIYYIFSPTVGLQKKEKKSDVFSIAVLKFQANQAGLKHLPV